jgi:hypothetical protein
MSNNLEIKIVKVDEKTNVKTTYVIPQKDSNFINIIGVEVNFDNSAANVILALTNIDSQKLSKFELPSLLELMSAIRERFPGYLPGTEINSKINQFIEEIFSPSFWLSLSSSMDCGYVKMDKRKFPYFNSTDQKWKEINAKNRRNLDPYPAEFNGEVKEEKAVLNTTTERRDNWRAIEQKAINLLHGLEIKLVAVDSTPAVPTLLPGVIGRNIGPGMTEIKAVPINSDEEIGTLRNFPLPPFGAIDLVVQPMPVESTPAVPTLIDPISTVPEVASPAIAQQVAKAVRYRPDMEKKELGDLNGSNYFSIEILEPQFYPNLDEYKTFITLLCKAGLTKLAVKALCILPLTYNMVHVIKCEWFWKLWAELVYNEHLKNFIIYYSMYVLKLEEIKAYNRVPNQARFVFSLDEAQLISKNIPHIGIDKHPLVHLMEPLGYKSSYMPFFLDGTRTINSMDVFKRRLSIACDGLLDDVDLSNYNAVLSGSILVPCVATNPLEKRFETVDYVNGKKVFVLEDLFDQIMIGDSIDAEDSKQAMSPADMSFSIYLECYYPSYKSVKPDELKTFIEPHQTNEEYEAQKHEDLNNPARNYPEDIDHAVAYGILSDLDISIHTNTFEEFKVQVYRLFEKLREKVRENVELDNPHIYIRRIRRGNSFKYSIYGPGINRPIDLFWITRSPDTFVEQFHLGVVRMYWDGKQVRIMQSALAALLSGINHDYRWMSCNKAPAIPVIKYTQRGYTTPLNKFERPILVEYISGKEEWCKTITSQTMSTENIYTPVMESNIFFMPDITKSGIRYGLQDLDKSTGINYNKEVKANNNRVRWIPINCNYHGIQLDYYNSSRNSIAVPTLDTINKIIDEDC